MKGTSWIREQGMQDALLVEALRKREMDDVPLWRRKFPERDAAMKHWNALTPRRDGPVNPERTEVTDLAAMNAAIKQRGRDLGAADVGMTALKPEFIELGVDLPHQNVIAIICYEDYAKSLEGPDEVDLEAMTTYAKCADVATGLAEYIREELGYPAVAHHNGSFQIQAIPVFYEVGFGELGRHGSHIHPELGANFRPGFVTTDLPVAYDQPHEFGVQDYCMTCNLCRNNCPGDAIPDDFITTGGIKRWLTDIDKCYPISRFRESYCHICVDVCPYIHKENGDGTKRDIFRQYMKIRKQEGYKTPKGNDAAAPGSESSESSSAHSFRDLGDDARSSQTAAAIKSLGDAALARLAQAGDQSDDGAWTVQLQTANGFALEITCTGPDLPAMVPEETISPTDIPKDPKWQGSHRLLIAAPLVAFDLYWRPGEPMRLMSFSRGDWEQVLLTA